MDRQKADKIKRGITPICEAYPDQVIEHNAAAGRLTFTAEKYIEARQAIRHLRQ